jgi:two-component system, NtrC family, response regulator
MAKVLIIDDEKDLCEILADIITKLGHQADVAYSISDGRKKSRKKAYDVVFLDVRLPDGNGLEAMPDIKKMATQPEIIIMTGYADPDGAEIAIKNGAWDYLQKPISPKQIIVPLKRVLQYRDDLRKSKKQMENLNREAIIGDSPRMKKCFEMLVQAANSNANVLITGETGTGKELFAKAVHLNSNRSKKPFVVVDCAALPKTIVESVLFGNVRGAYTGADKDRDGLIKTAHKGILFLDEIGELPLPTQKAFLRVIQEHRFTPVGSNKEIPSDFRLVAATNRNLVDMAKKGAFREDLLFRLRSITIDIPPLREHIEDIKDLAPYFTGKICKANKSPVKDISGDCLDVLCSYDWPGNVRELINTLEVALSGSWDEPVLFAKHLPQEIRIHVARNSVHKKLADPCAPHSKKKPVPPLYPNFNEYKDSVLSEAEKKYFTRLMEITQGDVSQACKISGLGRTRLYVLLKKHGVSRKGWSNEEPDNDAA